MKDKIFRFYVDIGGKNLEEAEKNFEGHLDEEGIDLFEVKEKKTK